MQVRLKKHADGSSSLSCTRADGTSTWQKNTDRLSSFFVFHDLTHFAVESTLRCRRGFYGLLEEGWNITDFGNPWPRGRIPADAEPAEMIVGCLDRERASGDRMTATEVNEHLVLFGAEQGFATAASYRITDEQLAEMRRMRSVLFERWRALPPGESLELEYERGG